MVHFVGAGCGAPDLITLRGRRLLEEADVIIYAGSLVNPALLGFAKKDCRIYNSAQMTLEEMCIRDRWMREWAERVTGEGATVVNGEGLICQETPDDAMIEECKISARRWQQTPENFKTKRFSIISCLIKFLTQQKDSYHEG